MAYKGPMEKNAVDRYKDDLEYHEIDEFGRIVYEYFFMGVEHLYEYKNKSKSLIKTHCVTRNFNTHEIIHETNVKYLPDGRISYYKDEYGVIKKKYDNQDRLIRYEDGIGTILEWNYVNGKIVCNIINKGEWVDKIQEKDVELWEL